MKRLLILILFFIAFFSTDLNAMSFSVESQSTQSEKLFDKEDYILQQLEAINARFAKRRVIWIMEGCVLITLFISLIYVIINNSRRNRNKNIAIVRQIKEIQEIISSNKNISFHFLYDNKKHTADDENSVDTINEDEVKLYNELQNLMLKERLYLNPNLCKEDIFNRLQTNKKDLCESLKKSLNGVSLSEYIVSLRISEALFLLENSPECTVEEIAEKVGFATRRTFYRHFKKRFDITPSEYRELSS